MRSEGRDRRDLEQGLRERADPEVARELQRFFKTGPGEYGEGDRFLGIRVPELRRIARRYHELPVAAVRELLRSPNHEARFVALLLLIGKYTPGCLAACSATRSSDSRPRFGAGTSKGGSDR